MLSASKFLSSVLGLSVLLFSCSKEINRTGEINEAGLASQSKSPGLNPREGIIYTMSNEASGNSILSYLQMPNGKLSYQSTTPSGGNGSGAGLGSQGSIVVDGEHNRLFAVNAGSNSVSSFRISEDGNLVLAHTVSANGTMPVSVTVHGSFLYVVNSTSSNISGYTVGAQGTLAPIPGSVQ